MSAPILQQFCSAADFDAATQTCAAPYWAVAYGGVPPLSIADASLIAAATLGLWALAWLLRPFVKAMRVRL